MVTQILRRPIQSIIIWRSTTPSWMTPLQRAGYAWDNRVVFGDRMTVSFPPVAELDTAKGTGGHPWSRGPLLSVDSASGALHDLHTQTSLRPLAMSRAIFPWCAAFHRMACDICYYVWSSDVLWQLVIINGD